ncbi:hypothetical protein CAEBREN_29174 [Caenorhabditis brenneri]|uniref:Uncharacterized protein n=1 Tax=Caenorhabditis brenneri TaxID=135651 RepID=G0MNJ5_CAEBE|nr:hypothetical protein CAEBREN_29174 [Caenorhabditis brenneri]
MLLQSFRALTFFFFLYEHFSVFLLLFSYLPPFKTSFFIFLFTFSCHYLSNLIMSSMTSSQLTFSL